MTRLQCGVIITCEKLCYKGSNPEGRRLLEEANIFGVNGGRLSISDATVRQSLRRAMEAAGEEEPDADACQILIHRDSAALSPITIEVFAARSGECANDILLLFKEVETEWAAKLAKLKKRFPLTDREAIVLEKLSGKHSEQDLADTLGISMNTLKSHRKNIYAKLNVSSRMELAILLRELS
ncbi:helix-turn-helix transcriptional regulator [Flexibacterium corallicola]|uniref:helix-turn-helix transcriptional regulator n=1 Tax=Flexibacterium corallicola TaxID=3037259 RepID=UPI00286ED62D|nr:helix-turn-helix transcriptional regulator [Pseudovibrio sp. M1P-2-3]